MNYEIELKITRERISDIEYRIVEINRELKKAESAKRDAEGEETLGLIQMGSFALRPIGTYNYISGSNDAESLGNKIKKLEQEKKDLEWELFETKSKLESLKEDFEYSKRPQAELVIEKDRIYIAGDEKKSNVISWLEHEVTSYIAEYNRIISSEEVAEYKQLKAEFEELVKQTDLPKATDENVGRIQELKKKYGLDLTYIIMDNKLIVEDGFSKPLETSRRLISYYEDDIVRTKKKYDDFKPTFMGKVLKGVGKKQKAAWDSKISEAENYYVSSINAQRDKIKVYEDTKAEFVDPAKDVLDKLDQVNNLLDNSYYVNKFINEIDTYKKNIENHTILKRAEVNSTLFSSLNSFRHYLDKNNLKLTREDILDAIFESEYHRELAIEVYNAIGYKPRKHKAKIEAIEPNL